MFSVVFGQQKPYLVHQHGFPAKKNGPSHVDPRRVRHVPSAQYAQHDGECPSDGLSDDLNDDRRDDPDDDRSDEVQCVRCDAAQCVRHDAVQCVRCVHDGDNEQLHSLQSCEKKEKKKTLKLNITKRSVCDLEIYLGFGNFENY